MDECVLRIDLDRAPPTIPPASRGILGYFMKMRQDVFLEVEPTFDAQVNRFARRRGRERIAIDAGVRPIRFAIVYAI